MRKSRVALAAAAIILAGVSYVALTFSPTRELGMRLSRMLVDKGLKDVVVAVSTVNTKQIVFSHINFAKDEMRVAVKEAVFHTSNLPYKELFAGKIERMSGTWEVGEIVLTDLPTFTGNGTWSITNNMPSAEGRFATKNQSHALIFSYSLKGTQLTLTRLPLSVILALVTGDKATGTGDVSGTLPITITPNGKIMLGKGVLSNTQSGIITLSPDALPGDAPQMELARTALANFHYTNVSLMTQPDKEAKPSIHLQVEGNNPEALEGRPIKLTVNLSGDVIETLESALMMSSPKEWMKP